MVTFRSCDAHPHKYKKVISQSEMQEYTYHDEFFPIEKETHERMDIAEIFFGKDLVDKNQERHPTPDTGPKKCLKKCPSPDPKN
jgi:hypothetical protein